MSELHDQIVKAGVQNYGGDERKLSKDDPEEQAGSQRLAWNKSTTLLMQTFIYLNVLRQ